MLVDLYVDGMNAPPIRLRASLVLVRQDNGTAVNVAGVYGDGGVLLANANDRDFNSTLRKLGLRDRTECSTLVLPGVPEGFQLVSSPNGD